MKIILLRHEKRNINNPLFYSELTEEGIKNSKLLINKLNKLNINEIYTSPFLRVVQTIYPYCKQKNKKIKITNYLYESLDDSKFNNTNSKYNFNDLPFKYKEIIDYSYSSKKIIDIKLFETFEEIKKRILPFINEIKNRNMNDNILIISHASILNAIKTYFLNINNNLYKQEMGSFIIINYEKKI